MWWLKANVRSYVELSAAITDDYCFCLDFMKDRERNGAEMCAKIHKGVLKTALGNIHLSPRTNYLFNGSKISHNQNHWLIRKSHAAQLVIGWRQQHKKFKLHLSTFMVVGTVLLITVILNQRETDWLLVIRSSSPNGLPTKPRTQQLV